MFRHKVSLSCYRKRKGEKGKGEEGKGEEGKGEEGKGEEGKGREGKGREIYSGNFNSKHERVIRIIGNVNV
ncbi:hypothetical protein [Methanosarcina sp. 1.H.A.2.2]|uniref:hypothetical protein n=1 Tax=Methanosarcina sp. 1.H.A.2.2 TaxID=1483601 RepID=UPI0006228804|nr:hypothetical protein [Methanosarcina sp. 1.H.A.2.2]KKH48787.1 hypothetical protein EO93_14995 [Methanosarcina sp. 1.H.A.2.2]